MGTPAEPASEPRRAVGAWATEEQIYRIDRAALESGMKRSHFLIQAALEKADQVLAGKGAAA
jgi:uncharacterized protein (DUF1778 family)